MSKKNLNRTETLTRLLKSKCQLVDDWTLIKVPLETNWILLNDPKWNGQFPRRFSPCQRPNHSINTSIATIKNKSLFAQNEIIKLSFPAIEWVNTPFCWNLTRFRHLLNDFSEKHQPHNLLVDLLNIVLLLFRKNYAHEREKNMEIAGKQFCWIIQASLHKRYNQFHFNLNYLHQKTSSKKNAFSVQFILLVWFGLEPDFFRSAWLK